ncbi:NAD(P)/FAD-dependent oxidoreductase [Streptosporangium sp. NBC_01756]|uniref:NAD(P)/FAD-dependent oxidoreductase n=1 Tax=Streptosporangium sp. NBC_01756 TaxID=2975950 RepID=UPI002DDC51ED|nr:FAD-binding oxidoreductase [Streptosporangium sp. NBC_01756]WSC84624.1 FAD-binding oxidoreductase [Streptosporangium sp. NBC_01756]
MTTRTADAVIVGAGVLGASVASHLARSGHRVLVLDRGAPGREGSGTTAGNLHMQAVHTKRPGQAVPLDSARFLPLQRAASDRWETLEEELETSVEVRRTGGFTIAETDEQCRELHDKHGWEAAAGIPTEILDGDAARAALPLLGPTVAAATWCDLDGYANPLKVTPAYLDSAARHGGRTLAFAPVRRITRNGDGWRVVAGHGAAERVVDTPVVVDVAGPWLGEIAAMAGITLRMTPVAIQMHATVRSSATMSHLVQHIGEGLSVKQVAAGNLLIGGGWPALSMDLAGRSGTSLDSLVGNVALAVRVLPFIRDLRLLRMWAGPLAATPDEMPVIGEVPGAPGFYVAGGTYAFTFAPLWGETLRCLIEGKPPPVDISDLGPGRLMVPAGGSARDNGLEQENPQDRRSKRC